MLLLEARITWYTHALSCEVVRQSLLFLTLQRRKLRTRESDLEGRLPSQTLWVQVPSPSLTSFVTLGQVTGPLRISVSSSNKMGAIRVPASQAGY